VSVPMPLGDVSTVSRSFSVTSRAAAAAPMILRSTRLTGSSSASPYIAGAVADVLEVGLDDLFDVRAVRDGQDGESGDRLSPSETARSYPSATRNRTGPCAWRTAISTSSSSAVR